MAPSVSVLKEFDCASISGEVIILQVSQVCGIINTEDVKNAK